jgi:ParB-like nuclease domain
MANTIRKISEIKIGTRHRKDMGDIQAFADNIKAVGLLHPVVINKNDELIAGERRIRAYELLGRTEIAVTVVDLGEIVHGEFAENEQRKNFTPSEAVEIQRAVGPLFKAEAKERQAVGGKLKGKAGAKLAQPAKGKTRDKIAKYTGIKRTSLKKAEVIVAASEAEPDNKEIAGLVKEMDTTGKVDGPYKQLTAAQDARSKEAKPRKPATNGATPAPASQYRSLTGGPDGNTPEQRWQHALGNIAGEAVALRAFWTRIFGDWEKYDCPSDLVTLAKQAAQAWTELAADLSKNKETDDAVKAKAAT